MRLWLGLRQGAFTSVGWQVTLCDPVRQVTLCSSLLKSYILTFIFTLKGHNTLWYANRAVLWLNS